MSILRVTRYGEPILRQKGETIVSFNQGLKSFSQDMIETMRAENGAGLAAQQVGKAIQLFVMNIASDGSPVDFEYRYDERQPPLSLIMPLVVCNPSVKAIGIEKDTTDEGCLSFPSMRIDDITRAESINMRFQDLDGGFHTLACNGFLARCCLHEYDHLQGVLFIDRIHKKALEQHSTHLDTLKRESAAFLDKQCDSEA